MNYLGNTVLLIFLITMKLFFALCHGLFHSLPLLTTWAQTTVANLFETSEVKDLNHSFICILCFLYILSSQLSKQVLDSLVWFDFPLSIFPVWEDIWFPSLVNLDATAQPRSTDQSGGKNHFKFKISRAIDIGDS